MSKKRLLVFASGSHNGGGSGFEGLVEGVRSGVIKNAEIVAVVSNYPNGGVRRHADRLGIPFRFMSSPWDSASYQALANEYQPDLICLSGWLKLVRGLEGWVVINIHPGPLPEYGGPGMYGHHVHEAVIAKKVNSAVTMHFVSGEYDRGPVFFRYPVTIRPNDTAETLGSRVNEFEHGWQPWITNLVLNGTIRLEGGVIVVPDWYPFL